MLDSGIRQRTFVYAVCGEARFINELSLSLHALRLNSKASIIVVTDKNRNEIEIPWSNVLHVDTPTHFNNHEASIHLKTSLHRILPRGPRYCYLDSDVFAMSQAVDNIFYATTSAVSFAADLSSLHQFSPYAVNCGCMQENATERRQINELLAQAYQFVSGSRGGWSPSDYERNAKGRITRAKAYITERLTPRSASQMGESRNDIWSAFWYESNAQRLHQCNHAIRFVEKSSRWRRDRRRQSWISPSGNDVFNPRCNHLVEAIQNTFDIHVSQACWRHWNGGVFVFDHRAEAFLDAWHEKTIRIFDLPVWRTRDQGTLVATVWEFGLQDQPLLPTHYNCILDANRGSTMVGSDGGSLTTDAFLTTIRPTLAHVISRVGDSSWDVWRWVHAHAFQA